MRIRISAFDYLFNFIVLFCVRPWDRIAINLNWGFVDVNKSNVASPQSDCPSDLLHSTQLSGERAKVPKHGISKRDCHAIAWRSHRNRCKTWLKKFSPQSRAVRDLLYQSQLSRDRRIWCTLSIHRRGLLSPAIYTRSTGNWWICFNSLY